MRHYRDMGNRLPFVIMGLVVGLPLFLVWYVNAAFNQAIPVCLTICLFPFAILDAAVILYGIKSCFFPRVNKYELLRLYGVETEATIIETKVYSGDGLHPSDTCFKGQFEFFDRQKQRHVYHYSGHCYDPFDFFARPFLEFPLEHYFREGSRVKVVYLENNPSVHTFYGPELTFVKQTE